MQTSTMLKRQRGLCKARGVTGIPYVTYGDVATQHGTFFMLTMHEMHHRTYPKRGEFYARLKVNEDEKVDTLVLTYSRYKELHKLVTIKLTTKRK